MKFGLFDNLQIDPLDLRAPADIFDQRFDDLAFAELLGFWGAFTAERHFMPAYRSVAPGPWIAAASQRTTTLRLGVLAYTLALHQPAQLAEEIAMLDHLTRGRLEVGVGLGHRPAELEQTGIDPAKRIPLFQERFAILTGMLSGASVRVESAFHSIRDVAPGVTPVQQPAPPLWYAGTDPRAAAWAGANGMDLAVGFAPRAGLVPVAAAFRAARADYEAKQAEQNLQATGGRIALMRSIYISDSAANARAEMADDIYRLNAIDPRVLDGSRENRRSEAEAEMKRMIEQEIVVGGSAVEIGNYLRSTAAVLGGIDIFCASVYPAGVEQDRVRRTMRLLIETGATID